MAELFDFQAHVNLVSREAEILVNTFREKGAQRFGRAIGAAAFLAFGSYMLLYRPPQVKSERLDAEISKAKTLYENAQKYKELRDQLLGAYSRLPSDKDRSQWLFNSVHESLDKSGLVTENIKSVQEQDYNGFIFQSLPFEVNVRFPELYDWILRVENARPTMHLMSINIAKKTTGDADIGYNSTMCEIGTVIPKKRYQ